MLKDVFQVPQRGNFHVLAHFLMLHQAEPTLLHGFFHVPDPMGPKEGNIVDLYTRRAHETA